MKDLGDSVSFTNEEMAESMALAEKYINLIMGRVRHLPRDAGLARMIIFQTMALGGLSLLEAMQKNEYLAIAKGIKVGVGVVEKLGDSVFDADSEIQFVGVEAGAMDRIKAIKGLLDRGEISLEQALESLKKIDPRMADMTLREMGGPLASVEPDKPGTGRTIH